MAAGWVIGCLLRGLMEAPASGPLSKIGYVLLRHHRDRPATSDTGRPGELTGTPATPGDFSVLRPCGPMGHGRPRRAHGTRAAPAGPRDTGGPDGPPGRRLPSASAACGPAENPSRRPTRPG
ncbi:hypothetical protein GCM10010104_03630 [Streptomyces indiaensis]|uniref:Uncharacterized protein n=1 Tax=Streptomyces indiaensis TaxID=284033 RepID=A0ABN3UY96_9ACTN